MLIQYASDLHLEFGSKKVKFKVLRHIDVLVLAGDIHTSPEGLEKFFLRLRRKGYEKPIVYVLGNHEHYNHNFHRVRERYVDVCGGLPGVFLLEKDTVFIEGVRFVGTCLYTDLSDPVAAVTAQTNITDFQVVMMEESQPITPEFWTEEHRKCREFLERELAGGDPLNTVVVTHFAPSFSLAHQRFPLNPLTHAFCADLSDLIAEHRPVCWFYGHNHDVPRSVNIGVTTMLSNEMGYYYENTEYEPKMIEI